MKIDLFRKSDKGEEDSLWIMAFMRHQICWLLYLMLLTLFVSSRCYAKQDESTPKPIFKLIKGQGTEVCEAYLLRLQATEFVDNDPTKGRLNDPLLNPYLTPQNK